MTPIGCTHCHSADVRPSRHSLELGVIGLFRYRCRACGGHFWLRTRQVEAVRARRQEYLAAPPGTMPEGVAAAPRAPQAALALLDEAPGAPAVPTDLRALDVEIARRRTDPRFH